MIPITQNINFAPYVFSDHITYVKGKYSHVCERYDESNRTWWFPKWDVLTSKCLKKVWCCKLINPNPTESHKTLLRKCKNWSKSDYVIIQVRNHWPGSVTGVAWHWSSRDWCARGSGINSGGNHHFWLCQFQMR